MKKKPVKCRIECDTEKIETLTDDVREASINFQLAVKKLNEHGVKVLYHFDTTKLDKKAGEIIEKSIYVLDAG